MAPHDILLQLLAGLHLLVAGALIIDLLRQHRSPAATLAWGAILLLLPYLGIVLYVLTGAPRKHTAALLEYFAAHVHPAPDAAQAFCTDTERLLRALGLPGATSGNQVRLCSRNEHAAEELLALIRSARSRLLLSVFSFEADASGVAILAAMQQRAAAGGRVLMFEPTVLHAKIVLLDDRVAMVGSANFDMRSLFTNHEVAAVLYSAPDIAAVAAVVEGFAAAAVVEAPPEHFATTVLSGALRIIAPLL